MQVEQSDEQKERSPSPAGRTRGEKGRDKTRGENVVTESVMIRPVRLLAEENTDAVDIGGAGSDHCEQPLPRCAGQAVGDAPTAEDVGLDVHLQS